MWRPGVNIGYFAQSFTLVVETGSLTLLIIWLVWLVSELQGSAFLLTLSTEAIDVLLFLCGSCESECSSSLLLPTKLCPELPAFKMEA